MLFPYITVNPQERQREPSLKRAKNANTSMENSQTLLKHECERKGYGVDEINLPTPRQTSRKKASLCAQSRQRGGDYRSDLTAVWMYSQHKNSVIKNI